MRSRSLKCSTAERMFPFGVIREFVPAPCPLCGKGRPADGTPNMFCPDCLKKLPFITGVPCKVCGGVRSGLFEICADCMSQPARPWRKGFALFRYEDPVRKMVRLFKYGGHVEYSRAFGRLAAGMITDPGEYECIVPVPLHWVRFLQRGYNQARLFSDRISCETGIPVRRLLKRSRNTRHQAFLDREEREVNLSGAFAVCSLHIPQKRGILLADDVMTTGATLAEAASVLLNAGAAFVDVIVAARRQRN